MTVRLAKDVHDAPPGPSPGGRQVFCDGCNACAPPAFRRTAEASREAAIANAWAAGFVPHQGHAGEWLCRRCWVESWPPCLKREAAELCRAIGVEVPAAEVPDEEVKPKRTRRKKAEA